MTGIKTAGYKKVPRCFCLYAEANQEELTEEYIAHLKADVMPDVPKSVENYMIKKVEQQLQTINKVKDYYYTKISITIT